MKLGNQEFCCLVAVVCMSALMLLFGVWMAMCWPSAAGCFGTLLLALGLWIAAWNSGRIFERDHGGRECGAPGAEITRRDARREGVKDNG